MTSKQEVIREREEAKKRLTALLEKTKDKTVYTICTHVSRSGMMRHIQVFIVVDGEIINIGWYVGKIIDWKLTDGRAVKVGGCGMDMGYHLVYTLSSVLYRTNDTKRGDSGYILKHYWI